MVRKTRRRKRPTAAKQRFDQQPSEIAAQLRKDITSGTLKGGTPLLQDRLVDTFSATRLTVRDALRILEHEGFVQIGQNKRATVAPLDPMELREIYEIRTAVETLALRLAIPRLTDHQIARAKTIQRTLEESPIEDYGTLNRYFHAALYEACERPRLLAQIGSLLELAERHLRLGAISVGYSNRSYEEHRALLAACEARDEERAVQVLADHITGSAEMFLDFLKEKGDSAL